MYSNKLKETVKLIFLLFNQRAKNLKVDCDYQIEKYT